MTESVNSRWHIERSIPLVLIAAIIVQTVTISWWASNASTRLDLLERRVEAAIVRTAPVTERIVRLEAKVDALGSAVDEIKSILRQQQQQRN